MAPGPMRARVATWPAGGATTGVLDDETGAAAGRRRTGLRARMDIGAGARADKARADKARAGQR